MVPRYVAYKRYYCHHGPSKVGSIVTLCMLMMVCMLLFAGVFFSYRESITIKPAMLKDNTIAVRIQNYVPTRTAMQQSVQQEYAVVQKVRRKPAKRRPEERTKKVQKQVQHTTVSERVDVPQQATVEVENSTATAAASGKIQEKPIERVPSSDDSVVVDDFLRLFTSSIEKNKTYPRVARRAGYEGVVYVEIVLGKQGRIVRYTLQKSSSHAVLDKAGLRLVKKIASMLQFQGTLTEEAVIVVPIRYELQ